jgi:hypothetical protein
LRLLGKKKISRSLAISLKLLKRKLTFAAEIQQGQPLKIRFLHNGKTIMKPTLIDFLIGKAINQ